MDEKSVTGWVTGWIFCTLGEFIQHIVDWGHDPAVCYRVVEDSESNEGGEFTRTVVVQFLPAGNVLDALKAVIYEEGHENRDDRISALLREMVEGGKFDKGDVSGQTT